MSHLSGVALDQQPVFSRVLPPVAFQLSVQAPFERCTAPAQAGLTSRASTVLSAGLLRPPAPHYTARAQTKPAQQATLSPTRQGAHLGGALLMGHSYLRMVYPRGHSPRLTSADPHTCTHLPSPEEALSSLRVRASSMRSGELVLALVLVVTTLPWRLTTGCDVALGSSTRGLPVACALH